MRRERVAGLLAGSALIGLLSAGCGAPQSTDQGSTGSGSSSQTPGTLRPISLPDLSKATASVQTQIRDRHSAMLRTVANRGAPPTELANAYGEMGKLLLAAQYREAAEPCFLNAQIADPADFRWPYYLAQLYRMQGELERSVPFFERVVQLQPNDVAAQVWLGEVSLSLGRPEAAEPLFARALSLQPGSLSARFGLGRVALARQNHAQAVTYLEEVLAKDPEAAGAHYPLAMAYRGLGQFEKADVHLRQREEHEILPADPLMVELDELVESPQAYESRGIRALNEEKWAEAATLFRKGLALDPVHPGLRHRLGTALYMLGDQRGAREQFEAVVKTTPDHRMAQYSLGVLLQAEGRHADAIERFTAALSSRPGYTEARLRLAASLRKAGRAKESLPHYEQILTTNPELIEARFGLAGAFAQLGRYRAARDRLQEGMKTYPGQPVFAHGLARLLAAAPDDGVRDGPRAMALVEELLKQGRTLDLGATMAMTFAELGRFSEAAALQRDLIAAAEKNGLQDVVRRLKTNLALYERSEPCRTPWADNELS